MAEEQKRYTKVALWLHWIIAGLILAQIAGGLYLEDFAPNSVKFELFQWHKSFGILILLLSLGRLGWRLANPAPPPPPDMPGWEKAVGKVTHILFYGFMIGLPLAGWGIASASPKNIDIVLFKFIPWPHLPFVPKSEGLEEVFAEVHEYMAFALLGLLALHVAAALKHHFINKDDILGRMVPGIKPKG